MCAGQGGATAAKYGTVTLSLRGSNPVLGSSVVRSGDLVYWESYYKEHHPLKATLKGQRPCWSGDVDYSERHPCKPFQFLQAVIRMFVPQLLYLNSSYWLYEVQDGCSLSVFVLVLSRSLRPFLLYSCKCYMQTCYRNILRHSGMCINHWSLNQEGIHLCRTSTKVPPRTWQRK